MTNAALWSPALGVAAGMAWNLANLWILTRLLSSWISPARSTRRVVGWLIVKLGALYPLAVLFLRTFPHLAISFGVGFTVVLGGAITWFVINAQRSVAVKAHGR